MKQLKYFILMLFFVTSLFAYKTKNLKEVLTLEESSKTFQSVASVSIDKEENIFVLDDKNCKLIKFDARGKLLGIIGSKGKGPGEFYEPGDMYIDNETICVLDSYSIHKFDINLNYINTDKLSQFFFKAYKKNERLIGIKRLLKNNVMHKIAVVVDSNNGQKVVDSFFEAPRAVIKTKRGDVSYFVDHYYIPDLYIEKKDEYFVYGHSKDNFLKIVDWNGHVIRKININAAKKIITDEEKKSILNDVLNTKNRSEHEMVRKAIHFPEFRPYFDNIIVDSKYIYVVEKNCYEKMGEEYNVLVFNIKGDLVESFKVNVQPKAICSSYFYSYKINEDEFWEITKYKLL